MYDVKLTPPQALKHSSKEMRTPVTRGQQNNAGRSLALAYELSLDPFKLGNLESSTIN